MSHDYFSALWRSAGMAPDAIGGRSHPAVGIPWHGAPAAADSFDGVDPFEAIEAHDVVEPIPRTAVPDRPESPPSPTDNPRVVAAAPQPPLAAQAPAAAPARDAHPLVQAALRWVAAGQAEPPPARLVPPAVEPAPSGSTRRDSASSDIGEGYGIYRMRLSE